MKRLLFICLMILCLLPLGGWAEESAQETFACGDFEYILLEDGTAEITGYTGDSEELVIPMELGGLRASSIGDSAFIERHELTSATIPGSVSNIDHYAFAYCTCLANVTIQDGVVEISGRFFEGCSSLTTVVIPGSVLVIGDYAFADCRMLADVEIREGVTSIGDGAYAGCCLTAVTVPESMISIGNGPFGGNPSLQEISVRQNNPACTAIDGVLFGKDGLVLVQYPAGRQNETYMIPDGITRIGAFAFECCEHLTTVIIPEGTTQIMDYAFPTVAV